MRPLAVLLSAGALLVAASTAAAEVSATGSGRDGFRGEVVRIDRDLRQRMVGSSWHRGCPVALRDLRLLKLRIWGFDGETHGGRLVVHRADARGMVGVFRTLFRHRYAIRRMRLVDAYGADDHRSMNADNTSAFNCREVAGSPGVWSQHAYGRAIDLNPVENPYVTSGGHVSPPKGRPYASRHPRRKGMIGARGRVVRAFAEIGWEWGGAWSGTKDFQHFSATGT